MNKELIDKVKKEVNIFDIASRLECSVNKQNKIKCYNSHSHNNGDSHPSLSLDRNRNRFKCFSCGVSGSVIDLFMGYKELDFNMAVSKLSEMYGIANSTTKSKVVTKYEYKDKEGKTLYIKERVEPGRDGRDKEFFFKHLKNGKYANGRGCEPALYNLPEVVGCKKLIFVEGEGKAELLRKWGLPATTLDSGAKSQWKDEYIKYIEGKEAIIILADSDKPGRAYASAIANVIHSKVGVVKVVELTGLDEKGDIIDWAKIPGNDKEKLLDIVESMPAFNGKATEENEDEKASSIIDLLEKTIHNRTINPSQDFIDGIMYYAINVDGHLYLITSGKELISFSEAEEKGIKFKTKSLDIFRFSQEGILKYYRDHKKVRVSDIYKRIYNLLGDYVFLKNDSHRKFLAVWAIGTYVFRIFRYYPYGWLTAEKGSGKSLLMEILKELCFNGDMSSNATEATIFRDVHNNSITMFLDEVEKLGKQDAEKYGAIMSILNTGFSSSGVVKRAGSKSQDFAIQRFSSYSPKMFAGIKEIDDVVQDRTIKISMFKKKREETTKRYKATDALIQTQKEIRDDLYVFGMQYGKDISDIYNNHYASLQGLEHLENRELDIWEPIFTIANFIDIENCNSDLTDSLSGFSKENSTERLEDNRDQNDTVKLLIVLNEMIDGDSLTPLKTEGKVKYYDTDEVLKYFQNTDNYSWLDDKGKNYLSKMLKNKTKTINEGTWSPRLSKTVRAYIIDTENIQDLTERYIGQHEDEHAYV
jgi:5S rRNA maturation endonuclease (ribonuclease M5)